MKQHVTQIGMSGTRMGKERCTYQRKERHAENDLEVGTNAQILTPPCSGSKINLHTYATHLRQVQAMNQCRRFLNL